MGRKEGDVLPLMDLRGESSEAPTQRHLHNPARPLLPPFLPYLGAGPLPRDRRRGVPAGMGPAVAQL